MKFVFPAGSTALLLFFLALVTLIKGCSHQREALSHIRFNDPSDTDASIRQVVAYSEVMSQGNLWFSAATMLLFLGFGCLLMSRIMRRRARLLQASNAISQAGPNPRPVRRRRRR